MKSLAAPSDPHTPVGGACAINARIFFVRFFDKN
jgi:hypothetical protein